MHRETTTAHPETWQFFSSCIEVLKPKGGKGFIANLFGIKSRQVERWSCDPDTSDSAQRNPLDKYEKILQLLCELGRKDVAIGAVDRQAKILDCDLVCQNTEPDKTTLHDELLDDLPAVARLHTAIRKKEDIAHVREALRQAMDELKQSYEAFLKETVN